MNQKSVISQFDKYLANHKLQLAGIVTGGAALALLGVITRETRDFDLIEPDLPNAILEAAKTFAAEANVQGEGLREDWLNNGPASLAPVLPDGWRDRLQRLFQGHAIQLWTQALGREELLLAKLRALCDRGLDLPDCIALAPTEIELGQAAEWIATQDLTPDWPAHVRATLQELGRRLGHGL